MRFARRCPAPDAAAEGLPAQHPRPQSRCPASGTRSRTTQAEAPGAVARARSLVRDAAARCRCRSSSGSDLVSLRVLDALVRLRGDYRDPLAPAGVRWPPSKLALSFGV